MNWPEPKGMEMGSHSTDGRWRSIAAIAALAMLALPAAAQAGTLSSAPPSSNYNTQPWFFGSQFNNFQVTNSGTDTMPSSAAITGPDAARFSINGDGCANSTLMDTNSCFVGVDFNPPMGGGTFNAQLEVPSNGTPNPLVIPLSAQALAGPSFSATPERVDFGSVLVDDQRVQTVTITNSGDFTGSIQQAFTIGSDGFTISDDDCSQSQVNPGAACTLKAAYRPKRVEDSQGSILVITDVPFKPVLSINLSGKGRVPAGPAPDTQITRAPPHRTKNKTASFQFKATTAGSSFECSLDGEAFAPCTSPATYRVRLGEHSFEVRATDSSGGVDPAPATRQWTVKKRKR